MKLLLDNCVAYRARELFPGHEVQHTSDVGFEELSNGELIGRAARQFDVLVTTDKKIRHEQNLAMLPLPIVELNTKFTRFEDLRVLVPHVGAALAATATHLFVSVGPDGLLEKLAPKP